MDEEKTCAWCNKETALALFGVLIGLVFIAMSLDTLRRIRLESPGRESNYLEGSVIDD